MKITLTGAAGRLGSGVCRALTEAGHEVRAVDPTVRRDLPVPIEIANLLDREACYRVLEGAEAVVHLANHPHDYLRDKQRLLIENVGMNTNVFQASYELDIKNIVFSSSIQAIGAGRREGEQSHPTLPYLPIDGDVPAQPTNIYGLSKQLSEDMLRYYAREFGLNCVALRFPFLSEGATNVGYHRQHVPLRSLNEAWSYLPLADAASLIVAILASDISGFRLYCPAAPRNRLGQPIAPLIETYFSDIPLKKPVEGIDSFFDLSQITQETGWQPRDE